METRLSGFMLVKDAAAIWDVSGRRVIMYLADGRIPGSVKIGNTWLIPKDAEKPVDGRITRHKKIPRAEEKPTP